MSENILFYEWLSSKQNFVETLNIPENILGDTDLKTVLKVKYGQRKVYKSFNELTGNEVANYLNSLYNSKWEWLDSFINESFDVGETNRKTITENFSSKVTGNQSGSLTNKESAYNTDEFLNSDQTESTSDNLSDQTGDRTRTESYKSYYTSLQQLKNVNSESMLELIINDIQKELCLQIY